MAATAACRDGTTSPISEACHAAGGYLVQGHSPKCQTHTTARKHTRCHVLMKAAALSTKYSFGLFIKPYGRKLEPNLYLNLCLTNLVESEF